MLVGVTRGLQMMADFLLLLKRVVPKHPEAWPDFTQVIDLWLAETTNVKGAVRVNAWGLLFGADPWQGSREAWKALNAKWAGKI